MSLFRLTFAGEVKKAEHRNAGGKAVVDLSICRKNRARQGEAESFTWIRVTVWEPADWQATKLMVGAFVAGSGEFTMRSFEKDGQKRQSAEVRCNSFDIEVVAAPGDQVTHEQPEPAPRRPAPSAGGGSGFDDAPFARSELELMP